MISDRQAREQQLARGRASRDWVAGAGHDGVRSGQTGGIRAADSQTAIRSMEIEVRGKTSIFFPYFLTEK